jgi:protein O-mannosyl-transferase
MKPSPHNINSAQIRLLAILLVIACAAVFVVHWPVLSAQANSFDDDEYLLDNNLVQNPGLDSAWRFLSEVRKPSTVEGYYQPLAMISLMLDYALGGSPDNLTIFHLTSLCLHAANTALIIVFLYMLFGNLWPAFFVGLLFGLHPMTVEPIPWISERKTLLASFFALWCLVLYVGYARKPSRQDGLRHWKLFAGVMLAYVLALMSKPTVTFLPVLLVILDFWPLNRFTAEHAETAEKKDEINSACSAVSAVKSLRKLIVEKFPLFAIMVASALVTFVSQKTAAGVLMPADTGHGKIFLIICHNVIFYLYKIFWPVNLGYYPYPRRFNIVISNPFILTTVIGTCILLVLLALSLRRTRAFFAGWLFFFIAIFPTMGIIGFTNVIASDKYAYFPAVGFLMVLAWLMAMLWDYTSRNIAYRKLTVIVILCLLCAESFGSYKQLLRWRTTETLYKYYLFFTPDVEQLHYNYGFYLYNTGRYEEAMREFSEQLRLSKQVNDRVLNVIGVLHYRQGNNEQALAAWQKVLEVKPDFPDALNNLAWIRATSGDARFRSPDEAIKLSLRACELMVKKQFMPDYLDTLAAAYASAGKFPQAIETARNALNLAQAAGKKDMAQRIQDHLDLYLAGKPFLENHP